MGSLIDETLLTEDVTLYYDERALATGRLKSYLAPFPEKFPAFSNGTPRIASFDGPKDLVRQVEQDRLDAIVLHQAYHMARWEPELLDAFTQHIREIGVRVVSLSSHYYDHLLDPLEALKMFDVTCITSPHSRELHLRILSEEVARNGSQPPDGDLAQYYDSKTVVTSSPMFDQISLVNPEAVRAKYGIPSDQKVVVFFAPFLNVGCYWRDIVASARPVRSRLLSAMGTRRLRYIPSVLFGDTINELVDAIRGFCDRENAILVVKSRPKQAGLKSTAEAADIFVSGEGDEFYPTFTSYELMAMADLCIQTYSFSALEAVVVGKPTLCIAVPSDFPSEEGHWRVSRYRELSQNDGSPGMFNYPGCVYSVKWHQAVQYLGRATLADFTIDPDRGAEYVSRFAGIESTSGATRVLSAIYGATSDLESSRTRIRPGLA